MRFFITGTNRGIGLALVRACLARGDTVFAACRQPQAAAELGALRERHPERLAVLPLDVLVNNAAIRPVGERPGSLDADALLRAYAVNSVGPLMVAQRFLDLLRGGERPVIVNVTSQLGSLARKRSGGDYTYNSSKAALNMLTRALAHDVRPLGIIAIMIHPGWVQTDMGGSGAPLTPEESAQGMLDVIDGLTMDDTARFLQWDGSELPW